MPMTKDTESGCSTPAMLGASPELAAVLRAVALVAVIDVTVLILGESGTGKELLAKRLHNSSRRANKPFVAINCAAIPETLAESELFGHTRGAFTGAVTEHRGRIPLAEGGTLFLDEIGDLPLNAQAKLLRFLETGECQAIGRLQPRILDVRVIAATHRDLYQEARAGRFREDLYYRLHVVPLELPPLRARTGDIPLLLHKIMEERAHHHGLPAALFSPATLEILNRYAWPGNVRELRHFCERMLVLMPGRIIQPDNLPQEMRPRSHPEASSFALPDSGLHLDQLEIGLIRQALAKTGGNRSRAARLLGISRDTLLYRIKKYFIAD